MDEPTAALGPAETAQVRNLVRQLKDEGIGIFLISHDIHDVFDLSDRISVMYHGRIVDTVDKADVDAGRRARDDHPGQEAGRGHREGAWRRSSSAAERTGGGRRRSRVTAAGTSPRQRRIQLAIDARALARTRRVRTRGGHGVRRDQRRCGGLDVGEPAGADGRQERRAVGRALGRLDRRDLGSEDVGQDLAPERAGGPAAGRPDLARAPACRPRSSGRARRAGRTPRPRAPHGSGAADRGRRSGPTNAPRASGSGCGLRSPVRYGRKNRPSLPAGTSAAGVDEVAEVLARRQRVAEPAQAAGRREHHRHEVPATGHGVAERMDPAVRLVRAADPWRRRPRPTSPARGPSSRATRRRPRRRWRPGRRRRRRPACRPGARSRRPPPAVTVPVTAGPSNVGGSQAAVDRQRVEDLRATSRGRRGRTGSSRRRRPCRWHSRRSGAGGRSPWAGARGRLVARRPARGRGPRRASAP